MTINNKIFLTIILAGTFFIFSLTALHLIKSHPRYYNKIKDYITESIDPDPTNLKNDKYYLHIESAESQCSLIKNDSDIESNTAKGTLVKVKDGSGYKIHKLDFSKYVLTKDTYELLKEIGLEFSKKAGDDQYFKVTSLTRTVEDQNRLTKQNVNATKNISSHSYGASFDISYIRFNDKNGENLKLQNILVEILKDLQKQDKLYVICEKNISCYHITVR